MQPLLTAEKPSIDVRRLRFVLGLGIGAFGMILMARTRLGSAPFEVLNVGLASVLGAPVAVVRYVVLTGIIGIVIWMRVRIGAALLLTGVIWASFAAVFDALLPSFEGLPLRVGVFAVGLVVMACGVAVYLHAGLGAGPNDAMVLAAAQRTGKPVWAARTAFESIAFVAGAGLGGAAGLGSLVFAVSLGPLIAVFTRSLRNLDG